MNSAVGFSDCVLTVCGGNEMDLCVCVAENSHGCSAL